MSIFRKIGRILLLVGGILELLSMAFFVSRISAVADAYASKQPLRPHVQGSPSTWTTA